MRHRRGDLHLSPTPVRNLCNTPNDTSIWDDTMHDVSNRSDITADLSSKDYSSPERNMVLGSPVKYATSQNITQLYTKWQQEVTAGLERSQSDQSGLTD